MVNLLDTRPMRLGLLRLLCCSKVPHLYLIELGHDRPRLRHPANTCRTETPQDASVASLERQRALH